MELVDCLFVGGTDAEDAISICDPTFLDFRKCRLGLESYPDTRFHLIWKSSVCGCVVQIHLVMVHICHVRGQWFGVAVIFCFGHCI